MFRSGFRILAFFVAAAGSHAGEFSWSAATVSPSLHSAGREVVVRYASPSARQSSIVRVVANRDWAGSVPVRTSLCWRDRDHCVPMTGGTLATDAFNGRDAGEAILMVHRIDGHGPLPAPVFVRGNVAVWHGGGPMPAPPPVNPR